MNAPMRRVARGGFMLGGLATEPVTGDVGLVLRSPATGVRHRGKERRKRRAQ